MKKRNDFLVIGLSAAAGAAAGILSNRKKPGQGCLIGAIAGAIAGAAATELINRNSPVDDGIGYYSNSSPQYEDSEDIEYI